jgi:hypothetical protein
MSIPVISVDIGPDKLVFNATSEGYQIFAHEILDRSRSALTNRQAAMTVIVNLEDIWRKTERFFADTVLQEDIVDPAQKEDIIDNINRIRVHMNETFVLLYKELASIIENTQQQQVDTEPINNGGSPFVIPSVIQEPALPRIVIDWSALANNRKVRWGFAGAVIGGAVAWFMSSRHPRQIEKRK